MNIKDIKFKNLYALVHEEKPGEFAIFGFSFDEGKTAQAVCTDSNPAIVSALEKILVRAKTAYPTARLVRFQKAEIME